MKDFETQTRKAASAYADRLGPLQLEAELGFQAGAQFGREQMLEAILKTLEEVCQYTTYGQVYMLQKDWFKMRTADWVEKTS